MEQERLGKEALKWEQREITQIEARCQSLQRLNPAFRAAADAIDGIGDQRQCDVRLHQPGNLLACKAADRNRMRVRQPLHITAQTFDESSSDSNRWQGIKPASLRGRLDGKIPGFKRVRHGALLAFL